MRQVFGHPDFTRVGLFKSVLDDANIPSFIRNQASCNSVDGLQGAIIQPALMVVNDEDFDEAMQILGTAYSGSAPAGPDWTCPQCAETVPGNFDSCWQCGAPRPGAAESSAEPL